MQLPIITTDTPGCRDVVIDGVTGYLCKPKDHEDLYAKMKAILDLSKAERSSMGCLARNLMKTTFDDKLVSDQYVHQINENKQ